MASQNPLLEALREKQRNPLLEAFEQRNPLLAALKEQDSSEPSGSFVDVARQTEKVDPRPTVIGREGGGMLVGPTLGRAETIGSPTVEERMLAPVAGTPAGSAFRVLKELEASVDPSPIVPMMVEAVGGGLETARDIAALGTSGPGSAAAGGLALQRVGEFLSEHKEEARRFAIGPVEGIIGILFRGFEGLLRDPIRAVTVDTAETAMALQMAGSVATRGVAVARAPSRLARGFSAGEISVPAEGQPIRSLRSARMQAAGQAHALGKPRFDIDTTKARVLSEGKGTEPFVVFDEVLQTKTGEFVKKLSESFESVKVQRIDGEILEIPISDAKPATMPLSEARASQSQVFDGTVRLSRALDFRDQVLREVDGIVAKPMPDIRIGEGSGLRSFPEKVRHARLVLERFPEARLANDLKLMDFTPETSDLIDLAERTSTAQMLRLPSREIAGTGTFQRARAGKRMLDSFRTRVTTQVREIFEKIPEERRIEIRELFEKENATEIRDTARSLNATPREIKAAFQFRRLMNDVHEFLSASSDSSISYQQFNAGFLSRLLQTRGGERGGGSARLAGERAVRTADPVAEFWFEKSRRARQAPAVDPDPFSRASSYVQGVAHAVFGRPALRDVAAMQEILNRGVRLTPKDLPKVSERTPLVFDPVSSPVEQFASLQGVPKRSVVRIVEADAKSGRISVQLGKRGEIRTLSVKPKHFEPVLNSFRVGGTKGMIELSNRIADWADYSFNGATQRSGFFARGMEKLPGMDANAANAFSRMWTSGLYAGFLGLRAGFAVKNLATQGTALPIGRLGPKLWFDGMKALENPRTLEALREVNLGLDPFSPFNIDVPGSAEISARSRAAAAVGRTQRPRTAVAVEGLAGKGQSVLRGLLVNVWWSDLANRATLASSTFLHYDRFVRKGTARPNTPVAQVNRLVEKTAKRANELIEQGRVQEGEVLHRQNRLLYADEMVGGINWWYDKINDPEFLRRSGSSFTRMFSKWPINYAEYLAGEVTRARHGEAGQVASSMIRYTMASYVLAQSADELFDADITDWFLFGPLANSFGELPFGYQAVLNLLGVGAGVGQEAFEQAVGRSNTFRESRRQQARSELRDLIPMVEPGLLRDFEKAQERRSVAPLVFGSGAFPKRQGR